MQALNAEQVRDRLRSLKNDSGRSLAKDLGISAAYLCDVLAGRREPGPAILETLGLERVVAITYQPKVKAPK